MTHDADYLYSDDDGYGLRRHVEVETKTTRGRAAAKVMTLGNTTCLGTGTGTGIGVGTGKGAVPGTSIKDIVHGIGKGIKDIARGTLKSVIGVGLMGVGIPVAAVGAVAGAIVKGVTKRDAWEVHHGVVRGVKPGVAMMNTGLNLVPQLQRIKDHTHEIIEGIASHNEIAKLQLSNEQFESMYSHALKHVPNEYVRSVHRELIGKEEHIDELMKRHGEDTREGALHKEFMREKPSNVNFREYVNDKSPFRGNNDDLAHLAAIGKIRTNVVDIVTTLSRARRPIAGPIIARAIEHAKLMEKYDASSIEEASMKQQQSADRLMKN